MNYKKIPTVVNIDNPIYTLHCKRTFDDAIRRRSNKGRQQTEVHMPRYAGAVVHIM